MNSKIMNKISYVIVFSVVFIFSWFAHSQAINNLNVVINEVSWMGTKASYNDEWIELYNPTDTIMNINNWYIIFIITQGKQVMKINLSGEINPKSFYLLERTDNTTVNDIPADIIYTGSLNNEGGLLQLYDENNNLIEEIDATADTGWPAGDNTTKSSMERKNPLEPASNKENWGTNNGQIINGKDATGNNILGTPKQQNSVYSSNLTLPENDNNNTENNQTTQQENNTNTNEQIESPQNNLDSELNQENQQSQIQITYSDKIYINEIYPNTLGVDSEEEWIEIYNDSLEDINLENWKLDDEEGASNAFIIPENTIIRAKNYLVLYRNKTNIALNNDKDEVRLFWPNETLANSVSYSSAHKGQSYNRIDNSWVWSANITPGNKNYKDQPADDNKNTTQNIVNENLNRESNISNQESGIKNQKEIRNSTSEADILSSINSNESADKPNKIEKINKTSAEINQGFNPKRAKNYFWLVLIIAPAGAFGLLGLKYFLKNKQGHK